MAINILDMFDKSKLNRFIDDFGKGNEYVRGAVYKEVINNEVYRTINNGVFTFSASLTQDHKNDVERNSKQLILDIPKIPYKYYLMLIDWYRDVQAKKGTEACLLFFWNKENKEIPADLLEENKDGIIIDGQLIVICPEQWNSSGVSKFAVESMINGQRFAKLPPMMEWLNRETYCIMETHSHHNMTAFWSSEDDLNERGNKLRMYSVYGTITNKIPMHKIRIGMLGTFYDISLEDIFEIPFYVEYSEKTNHGEITDSFFNFKKFSTKEVITQEIVTEETFKEMEERFAEESSMNIEKVSRYYGVIEPEENRFPESWWNMYNTVASTYTRNVTGYEKAINVGENEYLGSYGAKDTRTFRQIAEEKEEEKKETKETTLEEIFNEEELIPIEDDDDNFFEIEEEEKEFLKKYPEPDFNL